uniref:Ig-like domain-containing protein n=1 Tax=Cyprinodon variegatus TaxID=28743 RepID=A0A3Q2D425_CYPVA
MGNQSQEIFYYQVRFYIYNFPIIFPNKLQFFEYESVSIRCSEDNDINPWRVMRNLTKKSLTNAPEACSIPAPSCTIGYTFEIHSGEYWCENEEGKQSPRTYLQMYEYHFFSAGSVILTFPARPVNEGSDVTLHCINKNINQSKITEFFKDGLHHITNYENFLTIEKVSKSDEGLYKCSIFGAGESAESWLAVVKPEKGEKIVTVCFF